MHTFIETEKEEDGVAGGGGSSLGCHSWDQNRRTLSWFFFLICCCWVVSRPFLLIFVVVVIFWKEAINSKRMHGNAVDSLLWGEGALAVLGRGGGGGGGGSFDWIDFELRIDIEKSDVKCNKFGRPAKKSREPASEKNSFDDEAGMRHTEHDAVAKEKKKKKSGRGGGRWRGEGGGRGKTSRWWKRKFVKIVRQSSQRA